MAGCCTVLGDGTAVVLIARSAACAGRRPICPWVSTAGEHAGGPPATEGDRYLVCRTGHGRGSPYRSTGRPSACEHHRGGAAATRRAAAGVPAGRPLHTGARWPTACRRGPPAGGRRHGPRGRGRRAGRPDGPRRRSRSRRRRGRGGRSTPPMRPRASAARSRSAGWRIEGARSRAGPCHDRTSAPALEACEFLRGRAVLRPWRLVRRGGSDPRRNAHARAAGTGGGGRSRHSSAEDIVPVIDVRTRLGLEAASGPLAHPPRGGDRRRMVQPARGRRARRACHSPLPHRASRHVVRHRQRGDGRRRRRRQTDSRSRPGAASCSRSRSNGHIPSSGMESPMTATPRPPLPCFRA